MKPQAGSQVLYTLASGDAEQINRRRLDAGAYRRLHPANHTLTQAGHPGRTGFIAHFGNAAEEGQVYPAFVVRDWDEAGGTVNLQVLLDGNDTYWATSRLPGDGPGTWRWPGRQTEDTGLRVPKVGDPVHYVSYGTPGGEYGKACRAAFITEVTQVEVNVQDPAGDGIFRESAGLFVANPTGFFLNRGVLFVPGTYPGGERELFAGGQMPAITCADMDYPGGTWHWPVNGT